ncbi:DUF6301 family protein [Knoellia subterranea]|uniref:Uncharacterized protein n=1 Tax=Knoellia subterranea KCTC 19937 TaxID=1385521 RepID=A0A0A0JLG1_9MICO|nr:DUF6301 family protein [Knoellia subterranea]KGN37574.1 hypothetical protein N803_13665 [Knoellia subterranea KCTC 19937]
MSSLPHVPIDAAIRELTFWLDAPWPLSQLEAASHASALGWTVQRDDDGKPWVIAPDRPFESRAVIGLRSEPRPTATMDWDLTDLAPLDDLQAEDEVRDLFAEYVAAGRGLWGRGVMRRKYDPEVSWDLGDRGGIQMRGGMSVRVSFVSPDHLATLKHINEW